MVRKMQYSKYKELSILKAYHKIKLNIIKRVHKILPNQKTDNKFNFTKNDYF